MTNKEPGYVYILTNPSFREDWVKIGKSGHPRRGGEVSESENRSVSAGRKINLPIEHLPARDFLAYHREKVFVGV